MGAKCAGASGRVKGIYVERKPEMRQRSAGDGGALPWGHASKEGRSEGSGSVKGGSRAGSRCEPFVNQKRRECDLAKERSVQAGVLGSVATACHPDGQRSGRSRRVSNLTGAACPFPPKGGDQTRHSLPRLPDQVGIPGKACASQRSAVTAGRADLARRQQLGQVLT